MAEKINDGGPAFPRIRNHVDSFGNLHQESDGMTLRDWLAGQALVGQLANKWQDQYSDQEKAARAYLIADAMLLARQSATTVPQGGKSE